MRTEHDTLLAGQGKVVQSHLQVGAKVHVHTLSPNCLKIPVQTGGSWRVLPTHK